MQYLDRPTYVVDGIIMFMCRMWRYDEKFEIYVRTFVLFASYSSTS